MKPNSYQTPSVSPNVESELMLTCKRIIQCIVLTLCAGIAVVLALSLYTSATAAEFAGELCCIANQNRSWYAAGHRPEQPL
jgi:hypothetical protein